MINDLLEEGATEVEIECTPEYNHKFKHCGRTFCTKGSFYPNTTCEHMGELELIGYAMFRQCLEDDAERRRVIYL